MPLEELAFLGRIGVEEETDRDALKEMGLEVSGRGEDEEWQSMMDNDVLRGRNRLDTLEWAYNSLKRDDSKRMTVCQVNK